MHDFQKRTMFHLMLILNPQDLLQNRSLETVLVCIVVLYFPHGNEFARVMHLRDRAKRWSHALVLSVTARASSQNIKYQVNIRIRFPRKTGSFSVAPEILDSNILL